MNAENRYWEAKKATLISIVCNFLLGASKLLGGIAFHSHALIADGVHSFSDLLTDAMVLFASKFGSLDADKNHPYGHQRIETAATMFLAILLILAGAGIAWDAFEHLFEKGFKQADWLALLIIIVSILVNEILFHYTHYVGKRINSKLLLANAWHHRSDAASSVVVFIGIAGSLMGYHYFDTLAAIIVGFLIIKMGWDYAWNSIKELVDTAVEPELHQHIIDVIKSVNGVDKVHQMRSRLMGGDVFIDVHIQVAPRLSVSEGHYIAQHVHMALFEQIEQVQDVTVHIDSEDDESGCPSFHLPNRQKLEILFLNDLKTQFHGLDFWTLHYQEGQLIIDIYVQENFKAWSELTTQLEAIKKEQSYIERFRLFMNKSD